MPVTKRVRFEVLRRDKHTCKYCGASAPEVKLTVDHVVPVSLGGADTPENLVAACADCNAGKTSTSPEETLVDEVSEKALEMRELFEAAMQADVLEIEETLAYRDGFSEHLCNNGWTRYPDGWKATVDKWHKLGIPIEVVGHAVEIATNNQQIRGWANKWRYTCGIVWRKAQGATERLIERNARCELCEQFGELRTIELKGHDKKVCRECECIEAYETGRLSGLETTQMLCANNSGYFPGMDIVGYFVDRRGRSNE